jgi:ketosteroid isomerase-like protein
MLRSRQARREELAGAAEEEFGLQAAIGSRSPDAAGPEQEAVLADSVGLALLVVLDRLAPAERVAFVLHDSFGVPFDEIGQITGRSPDAARQLASRARRRVRGAAGQDDAPGRPGSGPIAARRLARQRAVAEAFIAASRAGDRDALLAVLDPDVVLHADAAAVPTGRPAELRGAAAVANGARLSAQRSSNSVLILVDGVPGIVYAPGGRVAIVLAFSYRDDRISGIEVIADPDRLDAVELAVLG